MTSSVFIQPRQILDDFAAFLKKILGIVTLTEKEVLFYVERMMENTSKLATCPFELTREDIEKIYRESIGKFLCKFII